MGWDGWRWYELPLQRNVRRAAHRTEDCHRRDLLLHIFVSVLSFTIRLELMGRHEEEGTKLTRSLGGPRRDARNKQRFSLFSTLFQTK